MTADEIVCLKCWHLYRTRKQDAAARSCSACGGRYQAPFGKLAGLLEKCHDIQDINHYITTPPPDDVFMPMPLKLGYAQLETFLAISHAWIGVPGAADFLYLRLRAGFKVPTITGPDLPAPIQKGDVLDIEGQGKFKVDDVKLNTQPTTPQVQQGTHPFGQPPAQKGPSFAQESKGLDAAETELKKQQDEAWAKKQAKKPPALDHAWACHHCQRMNAAGTQKCVNCGKKRKERVDNKCPHCGGTGKGHPARKTNTGPLMPTKCSACGGTGKQKGAKK